MLASDGDLMEGVASEASSLAGHQELGNLTVVYDANQISIEDDTDISFSEDVAKRYEAYGWRSSTSTGARTARRHRRLRRGRRRPARRARASKVAHKPTLVRLHTIIAWPAPTQQDTGKSHGSALGDAESPPPRSCSASTRRRPSRSTRTSSSRRARCKRGKAAHQAWDKGYAAWRKASPDRAELLDRLVGPAPRRLREGPAGLRTDTDKGLATRAASGKVLDGPRRRDARACGAAPPTSPVEQHDDGG